MIGDLRRALDDDARNPTLIGTVARCDHASAPGRGLAGTSTLHRIDPDVVRKQAQAAGFVFAGSSDVLINRADPLSIPVFDKAIRGDTSQFAFKFREPTR